MKDNQQSQPDLLLLDIDNPAIVGYHKITGQMHNLIEGLGGTPDGIAVDPERRLIYWSNMGEDYAADDGSINVANFDGTGWKVLVNQGRIRTPKQLQLDQINQRLYWCDREGGKVSSCNTDGSDLQTHIERPRNHQGNVDILDQCVGITVDVVNNWLYWTQKGTPKGHQGRLFRAPLRPTTSNDPANRKDIELLLDKLPEPIDLLLDQEEQILYWTDRGGEPNGNSLNKADITKRGLVNYQVICRGFNEAIGLTYDKPAQLMYVADLLGGLYRVALSTGEIQKLYQGNAYTGLTQYSAKS